MKLKQSFLPFSFLSTRSGARTLQKRAPKGFRLRFESLENREMLSATSGNDGLRVQFTEASVLSDSQVAAAYATTGDSLSDVIDARLEADGQNPEKLKESYIFGLSSLPKSTYTIYLDFNGHASSGTLWQQYYGVGKISTPAYDVDSNPDSFSNEELKEIYEIWMRVSEDFAPFNVNVTTKEPSSSALIKSGKNDTSYGVRVCIGGDSSSLGSRIGGISIIDCFTAASDTPSYVFSDNLYSAKQVAEAVSHETGHALGLDDDGGSGSTYYWGSNGWAPIMGAGYSQPLTQWSKGEYSGANNREDDLKIITTNNGFGYRSDDYGDNISSAKTISVARAGICASGIIEQSSDVDFFKFKYDGGNLNLRIGGIEEVTNLDAYVKLYDASGKLVQVFNPTDSTSVAVEMTGRAAGTYYFSVQGTGLTLNGKTIYSNYASLGQYEIVADTSVDEPLNAPGDLTLGAYNATKGSVSLSWEDNSSVETGFRVEFSKNGGEWNFSETMGANVTSRVATGVQANATYQFRVCALRGDERSEWVYSEILDTKVQVDPDTPDTSVKKLAAPGDLTLGEYDATTRRVTLNWKDNSSDETGFRVEFSKNGGNWNFSQTMNANVTTRVATGVQANATYQFRVCAVRGTERSEWVYSETLNTSVEKFTAPSDLTLGEYDATKLCVTLNWKDNSSDETGFRVEFSRNGGEWIFSETMNRNVTSRVATGVSRNSQYQFRVCAIRGNERSDWTYSEILDTNVKIINAPGNLTLGDYDATNRSVKLSWKDNSNNESFFRIEYSKNGGEWKYIDTAKRNATSFVVTDVQANASYQFRVCAFDCLELSDWTYSQTLDTSVKEIKAPSDLTLGDYDATKGSIALSWKDNANNETGFRVEYSKDGGKSWNLAQVMGANATSRVATGVQANALYKFRVCALNGDIRSDWVYSETLDTTPGKAPTSLTLGDYNANTRRVSLSWVDNSSDETGFRVEYSTDGGKTWTLSQIMDANVTSRTVTGVQTNSSYQFRVCALYKDARSAWAYSKKLNTSVQTKSASAAALPPYKSLLSATFAEFGDDEAFDFEL